MWEDGPLKTVQRVVRKPRQRVWRPWAAAPRPLSGDRPAALCPETCSRAAREHVG